MTLGSDSEDFTAQPHFTSASALTCLGASPERAKIKKLLCHGEARVLCKTQSSDEPNKDSSRL